MSIVRFVAPALALVLLVALGGSALAHDTPPLRTIRAEAGPYLVVVGLYSDPPRVAQVLGLTLTLADPAGATVTLAAVPGPGTDAAGVTGRALPDGAEVGVWIGVLVLPARGAWNLEISVTGPAGSGTARVPVVVAEVNAMPESVAWVIGLSPLAGLLAFALIQRRRLREGAIDA